MMTGSSKRFCEFDWNSINVLAPLKPADLSVDGFIKQNWIRIGHVKFENV